jgi:hypothetical protein
VKTRVRGKWGLGFGHVVVHGLFDEPNGSLWHDRCAEILEMMCLATVLHALSSTAANEISVLHTNFVVKL